MLKSFQTLLWCFSVVFLFTITGFAQESKGIKSGYAIDLGVKVGSNFNFDGVNALLWDNFLTQSTTGIVAGEWGGLPVGANQVLDADDFFVPSAATWTIDQIAATGFFSVLVDPQNWGVAFYADNAGVPGTLIQAVTVPVVAGDPNPAGLLSSPVVLTGGSAGTKYWISIYAISATATTLAEFRWNWYASEDPEILSEPYLRDDALFFGGTGGWVTYTSLGLPTFNALMFQLYGTQTGGCPVGAASNPGPADGTTGVDINTPGNLTWTNGAGTSVVEVFFGPAGNLVSVYNGTAITSFAIPSPLLYNTSYEWSVVCANDTCNASAATWSFTTEQDPSLNVLFFDDFEAGSGLWTITNNPTYTCLPTVGPRRSGYTLPGTGNVLAFDTDVCGSTTTGLDASAEIIASLDASLYTVVTVEFDNDWQAIGATDFGYVEVSVDGGTTWTIVKTFDVTDVRNTHEFYDISSFVGETNFKLRLRSVQPGWDWWWVLDNFKVVASGITPVELVSFAASVNKTNVTLNWSTATETNNSGFQVERSNGSEFEVVGFVAGHGTTTEVKNYSFVDQNLSSGNYSYRLKQVDFNGTFEYSNTIEAEILVKEFSLGQNYPNPFNPSTTIKFSLAIDSKVSLKIFDVLGQEVATLLNRQIAAGSQTVNFDASQLNSGVYFYQIDATGVDGQNFTSTKKMILTK